MIETFVIIGGDAAGMSAASKAKRDASEMDVIVFEKGEWVSYGACGLPYYIEGRIDSLDDLVGITTEEFIEKRGIDLRINHVVEAIHPRENTVTVTATTDDETIEQPYDHLLIATGARATDPPIGGLELEGVYTLHRLDEARTIKEQIATDHANPVADTASGYGSEVQEYMNMGQPQTIGLVGGGYISLEMAEAFEAQGLDVHLFQRSPHVLTPFGAEIAAVVEDYLREQDVTLHLGSSVERLIGEGDTVSAIETSDETIPVDSALVATGATPNTDLAEQAGIEQGPTGAIATDEFHRTNYEDIYAAGDCAEATHAVTGDPVHIPLALTANRHGRAVGRTVAGTPTAGGPVTATAALKSFDLEIARAGVGLDAKEGEQRAREAGFDPISKTITAESRADYYPGGSPITIHMIADRETGRLLGAAMVGEESVAKRLDTVATALHAQMTVGDVERLDLSYAPPVGPVWGPVLTAAKVLNSTV
jgi:NADPH-dependent 2,4-dienoyl-CoA reductase/sulfur reductase-like enzyme